MNNILIILGGKINQTGNIEKKRMPFQCHSCGPAYYLWTSLKKTKPFSGHTSVNLEFLTGKKHQDHLLKPSQFQRVIFGLKEGGNLSEVIISICLSIGLGTQFLAY